MGRLRRPRRAVGRTVLQENLTDPVFFSSGALRLVFRLATLLFVEVRPLEDTMFSDLVRPSPPSACHRPAARCLAGIGGARQSGLVPVSEHDPARSVGRGRTRSGCTGARRCCRFGRLADGHGNGRVRREHRRDVGDDGAFDRTWRWADRRSPPRRPSPRRRSRARRPGRWTGRASATRLGRRRSRRR